MSGPPLDRHGFLRALWPEWPKHGRLVLWSLTGFAGARRLRGKDRDSWVEWHQSIESVPAGPETDLYFGTCLQDAREEKSGGRGCARTVLACPGLWLDLDVGKKPKGKKNYPATRADANRIIAELPLRPAMIVESGGGGLHVYWPWREPWCFETVDERRHCAALVEGWQHRIRSVAKALGGWELDSTHDLPRVLRLPGTLHSRTNELARVIHVDETARVNQCDVEEWVDTAPTLQRVKTERAAAERIAGLGLVLDPHACAPESIGALLETDSEFARIWRRAPCAPSERRAGWSQSEYDLSITTRLLDVGFSPQQVVNSLAQHRREGCGRPLPSAHYVQRTLSVAQASIAERAERRAAWIEDEPAPAGTGAEAGMSGPDDDISAQIMDAARPNGEEQQPPEAADAKATYVASSSGTWWRKRGRDGVSLVRLANFSARIRAEIVEDDGAEERRLFEIQARRGGNVRHVEIPAERFGGMNWVAEALGALAIVEPGQGLRERLRAAVQECSHGLVQRHAYAQTGWRGTRQRPIYLHAGGAIGAEGAIDSVETRLPVPLANYELPPPPTGEQLVRAVRDSLAILDLASDRVTVPVVNSPYRAALGVATYSIALVARTHAGKTELAALAQQHYGPALNATQLPANWSSTANSLEMLAHACADALLVVDDFNPTGKPRLEVQRLNATADRLLRAAGNHSGRGRLRALRGGGLSNDAGRAPRGLILSTGEDVPSGHSLRGRILVVPIRADEVDFARLTVAQAAGADGAFARALSGWIRWLVPSLDAIRAEHRTRALELRAELAQRGQHRRCPTMVGDMLASWELMLRWAHEIGAVTDQERAALLARARAALVELSEAQGELQRGADPAELFVELLVSAISSGEAYLSNPWGGAPQEQYRWGWRVRPGTDSTTDVVWEPRGLRIGWLRASNDEDPVAYLDIASAIRAARRMESETAPLTVSQSTLGRQLDERGFLAAVDSRRHKYTVRRTIGGVRQPVLALRRELLVEVGDEGEEGVE